METTEIAQLSAKLREYGEEVLHGTSKLTLSCDQLNNLLKSFSSVIGHELMESSFHVITSSNAEEFRDLQFLHDFMQRAISLKLTPPNNTHEDADLVKFKNLKLLELHKVSAKIVTGIARLRPNLQHVVCKRSINYLADILVRCGADDSTSDFWSELRTATFSHNSIQTIDRSLEFATSLRTLDLSHNDLTEASGLNCLVNLKNLNLSYNKLSHIPEFTGKICSILQILVISNNFIEVITEVSALSNLCELDLSQNCLIEHNSLVPLASTATLQWLNLTGNPLCYHPQHRTKTSSCLHDNVGTVRFMLDRVLLSKSELQFIGSLHPRVPRRPTTFESTSYSNIHLERPRQIREATISDSEQSPFTESHLSSLVISGEHLETKRQIEEIRKKYQDKWLHEEGGLIVQDVLGLERTPLPACSTPYGSADVLIQSELQPKQIKSESIIEDKSDNYTTALEVITQDTNSLYENVPDNVSIEDVELGEGEESIYLATILGELDLVFIVITTTHIFERECTSTRERTRWPIKSLICCEVNDAYIQLHFDTVRNDCRERKYVMEINEMKRLSKALSAIVENRPPEESQLTVYNCMKCNHQFTADKRAKDKNPKGDGAVHCPSCKSPLVFEDVI